MGVPGRGTVLIGERGEEGVSIMLEGFDVTTEAVKQSMHHGDPLMFIELRHHHKHDWSLFKVRGALRIESDALEQHLEEIPHDRPIVVLSDCPGEEMSIQAAEMLRNHGWSDVHKLVRGFDAYLEAGLPVVPASNMVPATKIMLL
ncbi:MAG: rhodanese-like domain-containing protein [Desulfuromonadaceae bacterium]